MKPTPFLGVFFVLLFVLALAIPGWAGEDLQSAGAKEHRNWQKHLDVVTFLYLSAEFFFDGNFPS